MAQCRDDRRGRGRAGRLDLLRRRVAGGGRGGDGRGCVRQGHGA